MKLDKFLPRFVAMEDLATAIRQEKEIVLYHGCKRRNKTASFGRPCDCVHGKFQGIYEKSVPHFPLAVLIRLVLAAVLRSSIWTLQ